MERIVVEVNDASAKKWQFASTDKKEKLAKSIEQLINTALSGNEDDFWQFVDRISTKSAANGLTEEELTRLLNE